MKTVVVGCGKYASVVHLPYLQRSAHADIVGTVDPNPYADTSTLYAPHLTDSDDLGDFLTDVDADAVIISTPPQNRQSIYDTVLGRPLHIHIDKPFLAPSSSDEAFRQIYQTYQERFEQHRCPVSIHSQRRFDTNIRRCKKAVQATHTKTGVTLHAAHYEGFDGNFRCNDEWSTSTYHSIEQPLGIVAHSYYHYIDVISYLAQSLQIMDIDTTVSTQQLSDVAEQNKHGEKALLRSTSTPTDDGPIALQAKHTLHTKHGQSIDVTVRVSHFGATRRNGRVENQYTENRYSQKRLSFHAGSLLSADYTSRPIGLQQPKTKRDKLRIDNALKQQTKSWEQKRREKLDRKRRRCLRSFIASYVEGENNPSSFSSHQLTHELYLNTAQAVMQANR